MFDGHYKEKEASTIPVPNIKWPVFTSMMRAIYTGGQLATPALSYSWLCTSVLHPWCISCHRQTPPLGM